MSAALVLALGPSAGASTGGTRLWVARYNGPGNGDDDAWSVASSPDGSKVFVTGSSYGTTNGRDYLTVAHDAATGTKLWVARYNGPGNGDDYAFSVASSPDGSKVFVTGQSTGATLRTDYATVAYDAATGAKLWVARYGGSGDSGASSVAVSPDGSKVFVTGSSCCLHYYDYATVAYDAATGTQLWVTLYTGPAKAGIDGPTALGVSPDGSKVFVTGYSRGAATGYDYATVAYAAATGTQLWVARYKGLGGGRLADDIAFSLSPSPDGSKVFVTGQSLGPAESTEYATVAYDAATGTQLWVARFNGPSDSSAYSVASSPDGSKVFVTGRSFGANTGDDYATVAYDAATGTELWAALYNGPGNGTDVAYSLAPSPDGSKVFVTGSSRGAASGYDYATVAYAAANGTRLWVRRYNGPANNFDVAVSLAPSPDGSKVFVTGRSFGTTTGYDYATVAYAA